ncbi:hypothetical protein FY034_18800 (plasmid) [Trichlorobacter lovleyi]|uniref:hypothetical protein n=1 Tax=Trichlorobacter lovleyi TaxID=313985 RepID=UPI0022405E9D|nr:hypothetical protein [Trichlorobacter lovleyi]QOX81027.1 hypothetical protein FY034_18800 [Trichlorobacter lovleyi]
MSNVLYLEDNAKFLVNQHSAVVDDFAKIAKDWDSKTLRGWLDISKYAAKHLGYHCQVAHSPEDVVMLCDMAVELGWMVSITIVVRPDYSIAPLPKQFSTQMYAVKSISKEVHKLYMRVELGQPVLRCLAEEYSGVFIAGSTVEYPGWLEQVKNAVVSLGETDPEKAFMAMASYSELYKSWESGKSPAKHVEEFTAISADEEILQSENQLVQQIKGMHPDWTSEYARGYSNFLAGVNIYMKGNGVFAAQTEDFMQGWSDAKKIHEIPFPERITA